MLVHISREQSRGGMRPFELRQFEAADRPPQKDNHAGKGDQNLHDPNLSQRRPQHHQGHLRRYHEQHRPHTVVNLGSQTHRFTWRVFALESRQFEVAGRREKESNREERREHSHVYDRTHESPPARHDNRNSNQYHNPERKEHRHNSVPMRFHTLFKVKIRVRAARCGVERLQSRHDHQEGTAQRDDDEHAGDPRSWMRETGFEPVIFR